MADKKKRGQYPGEGSPPPQTVKRSLAEVALTLEERKKKRRNLVPPTTLGDRPKTLEEMRRETATKGWKRTHMAAADFAARFRRAGDVPVAVDEDN